MGEVARVQHGAAVGQREQSRRGVGSGLGRCVVGVGQPERSEQAGVERGGQVGAGDLLDDLAEQDRVHVAVLHAGAGIEFEGPVAYEREDLGGRELLVEVAQDQLVERVLIGRWSDAVVAFGRQAAGVGEELADRDAVAVGEVHSLRHCVVEAELALVDELQRESTDERLGDGRDRPRHVRVEGRPGLRVCAGCDNQWCAVTDLRGSAAPGTPR